MPGIGADVLSSLCKSCNQTVKKMVPFGTVIYLPKGRETVDPNKVFTLRQRGLRVFDIAKKFGVTDRRIYQILKTR